MGPRGRRIGHDQRENHEPTLAVLGLRFRRLNRGSRSCLAGGLTRSRGTGDGKAIPGRHVRDQTLERGDDV
jgi:hypothetical protein